MLFLRGLLLVLSVHICYGDYIAAVVEYNPPSPSATPTQTLEENVANYIYQIETAKNFGAQIIVFPEYGLTGLIDSNATGDYALTIPEVGTSGFLADESSVLLRLSNAAVEHNMYIAVNLLERDYDTSNNTIFYNTNIVFANNGTLVAKYRKINLFDEPNLTPGNDLSIFTTDFGTFALITCMDILYHHPSETVFMNATVTDVIYTAAWNSYTPFYMSLEVQLGYALANKVNLLAANINNPINGRGGSSIISGDGVVLRKVLTDTPATNIIYANVQRSASPDFVFRGFDIFENETRSPMSNYKNLTDFNYDAYSYHPLDLTVENITDEICSGDFCCSFSIFAYQNETNTSEIYKLVAYQGPTKFGDKEVNIKFCTVVACLYDNIASCGVRPPEAYTTTFRQIKVWGIWEPRSEEFFRPVSFRSSLDSLYNATYLENLTDESVAISYNITLPHNDVVLFGLFARGGVGMASISLSFVAFLVILQGIF